MSDINEEKKHLGHQAEETDPLLKAKTIFEKYAKPVAILVAAVIIVVGGWYSYKTFIVAPNEEKASLSMYNAEAYFRMDSVKLALNGDGAHKGFVYIINNFGGTKAANLAKYYAGICYLKSGDFNNAVKYLEGFSTSAKQIQMMAYGTLADAYSELGKKEDAIKKYQEAATTFTNDEVNSSEYLFRAAALSEINGNTQQAVELYKKLKSQFPNTQHGRDADKYIHRLSDETGLTTK